MSKVDEFFETCAHKLLRISQKSGGYLTYDMVVAILAPHQARLSVGRLDALHNRLRREGVQFVDHLPKAHSGIQLIRQNGAMAPQLPGGPWHRSRSRVSFRRRLPSGSSQLPECQEKLIDEIIDIAQKESVPEGTVRRFVRRCGLSKVDAEQLVDYLLCRGLDVPYADLRRRSHQLWSDSAQPAWEEEASSEAVLATGLPKFRYLLGFTIDREEG